MSKSENRPSQAAMKKMGFFVSEAFCHLKHRPYFSNNCHQNNKEITLKILQGAGIVA